MKVKDITEAPDSQALEGMAVEVGVSEVQGVSDGTDNEEQALIGSEMPPTLMQLNDAASPLQDSVANAATLVQSSSNPDQHALALVQTESTRGRSAQAKSRKNKKKKKTDDDDYDRSEDVVAGVESVQTAVDFAGDPNVQTGGAALVAIGGLVCLAPPPAGPIVGMGMVLAGSLMQAFGPKQKPTPSAEMVLLGKIHTQLNNIEKKVDVLTKMSSDILDKVDKLAFEGSIKSQRAFYKKVQSEFQQLKRVYNDWNDKDWSQSYKVEAGKRLRVRQNAIVDGNWHLKANNIKAYVDKIEKELGDYEAARVFQWLLTVRAEAFNIVISAENVINEMITTAMKKDMEKFADDMKELDDYASGNSHFRSLNANASAMPLYLWKPEILSFCNNLVNKFDIKSLIWRTERQKSVNCVVYKDKPNRVYYNFAFPYKKSDGLKTAYAWTSWQSGAKYIRIDGPDVNQLNKGTKENCFTLGHFYNFGHSASPDTEMYCQVVDNKYMRKEPEGYYWTWNDIGSGGKWDTTWVRMKCPQNYYEVGSFAGKLMQDPWVSYKTDGANKVMIPYPNQIRCLHVWALKQTQFEWLWRDAGSGATYDAYLYKVKGTEYSLSRRDRYPLPNNGQAYAPNYDSQVYKEFR